VSLDDKKEQDGQNLLEWTNLSGLEGHRPYTCTAPQAVLCGACVGESKYDTKQAQGWQLGEAVEGIFSFGTFTTVFKRAITYTNWLVEEYPGLRFFEEIDRDMTDEFLNEKARPVRPILCKH
jgi:hypothetical protein